MRALPPLPSSVFNMLCPPAPPSPPLPGLPLSSLGSVLPSPSRSRPILATRSPSVRALPGTLSPLPLRCASSSANAAATTTADASVASWRGDCAAVISGLLTSRAGDAALAGLLGWTSPLQVSARQPTTLKCSSAHLKVWPSKDTAVNSANEQRRWQTCTSLRCPGARCYTSGAAGLTQSSRRVRRPRRRAGSAVR